DVSLPDTVYVGLFVCAHNDTVVERAAFSNVRITIPAKRDFVPYRDYIGSNLEILDVASGNATIVHQYRGSFQAPNWTRDGKALIYAQEGRLYRFDLSSRSAKAINTGFDSLMRRDWTTGPSTRPTASTSTSTRPAADGCRSGACDPMEAARNKSPTTASTTGSRTSRQTGSGSRTSHFHRRSLRMIIRSTSTCFFE